MGRELTHISDPSWGTPWESFALYKRTGAGVPALGVWNVANRILQVPFLLLSSLWRVSFPGMSRLVEARENVGQTIQRVVAMVAVAAGRPRIAV